MTVIDNGIGISKENLPYVLDPFFSTKNRTLNFGLGLSFCYNFMQKSEGTLEIESKENIGTTISLIFPGKKVITSRALTQKEAIDAALEIAEIQKLKIIMLTSMGDEDIIAKSFIAGAVNYISKTMYKEVPDAIRSTYHNCSLVEIVLKDYVRLKQEEQLRELTPTERKIYDLVEKGYTLHQIETTLYIAGQTVKNHIGNMLKKLGVCNCKDAIKKVSRKGLFEAKK